MEKFFKRYFTRRGFGLVRRNLKLLLLLFAVVFGTYLIQDVISNSKPSIDTDLDNIHVEQSGIFAEPVGDVGFEVQFIDIGQGDASFIICDGECMLIDAGDNEHGQTLVDYLNNIGVRRIDYVIGTHPDADHIGGLDDVIKNFKCRNIYLSAKESDSETFKDVKKAIKKAKKEAVTPPVGYVFGLGRAKVEIIGPVKEYEDNNNNSIAVMITFNNRKFLFTGDTESEGERDLIASDVDLKADVLKCGHHGSKTSTSYAFLNIVDPEYAIISCGKDNKYGHPHKETLSLLRSRNIKTFRTDTQGTIIFRVKNGEIYINMEPDYAWNDGNNNEATSYNGEYVLNTNTYKFHLPDCESALKMSDKNKEISNKTRYELIEEGYVPCNSCKP